VHADDATVAMTGSLANDYIIVGILRRSERLTI
jgi:hypothetical protein